MIPMSNPVDRSESDVAAAGIFRPVQYLGNKLRTLADIDMAAHYLIGDGGHVVDLFSGTSVVSQMFARTGRLVSAVDTQRYAGEFAHALLGVGRKGDVLSTEEVLEEGRSLRACLPDSSTWIALASAEKKLIEAGDAAGLADFYQTLPLHWRTGERGPLLTSLYSGTYFGVDQALELDQLRSAIEELHARQAISRWQRAVYITALLGAASAAVHSAGKHFAQPLASGGRQSPTLIAKRLIQDRSISIAARFESNAIAAAQAAVFEDTGHRARVGEAEEFMSDPKPVDLYYLDPPYTAQQYSRFYHVLEVITDNAWPSFPTGVPTTGIYPSNRYKSAFSSKKSAPQAFGMLLRGAHKKGASVMISYSDSSAGSDGNARMISLATLLELCIDCYGRKSVEHYRLGHRYRQFNSAGVANAERNDPEVMVLCKP